MLTKAQFQVAKQIGQLPQPAAPVAATSVSVFAKAKNLINSISVNSRTAKLAIGSIVMAAVVYAGFKFATAPAKKAEADKQEQKTTNRIIAKIQEARTAAGKAVTLLSTHAKQFNQEHPVAVKVIGAAVVAGGALGLAKLLYKPAAQPSSVANAQLNDLCFQGDVIDFDGPNGADSSNPNFALGTMHEETYGTVEGTDSFELDANQLAVQAKFKNDVFYGTASTRAELAECMEKFNKEHVKTVSTPVSASDSEPVSTPKAPKAVDQWFKKAAERARTATGVNANAEKVKQQASDKAYLNSFLGEDLEALTAAEKVAFKAAENEVRAQDSQSFFDKMLSRAHDEAAVNAMLNDFSEAQEARIASLLLASPNA